MPRRACVRDGCPPLQLGLGDSDPLTQAWLTPAVMPHPNVELIRPAAATSSIPAVSHCSLAVSKAVRQGWSPVPSHEAWHEWHPAPGPRTFLAKQMYRLGRLALLAVSYDMGTPLRCVPHRSQLDGFKSARLNSTRASSLCCLGTRKGRSQWGTPYTVTELENSM